VPDDELIGDGGVTGSQENSFWGTALQSGAWLVTATPFIESAASGRDGGLRVAHREN